MPYETILIMHDSRRGAVVRRVQIMHNPLKHLFLPEMQNMMGQQIY